MSIVTEGQLREIYDTKCQVTNRSELTEAHFAGIAVGTTVVVPKTNRYVGFQYVVADTFDQTKENRAAARADAIQVSIERRERAMNQSDAVKRERALRDERKLLGKHAARIQKKEKELRIAEVERNVVAKVTSVVADLKEREQALAATAPVTRVQKEEITAYLWTPTPTPPRQEVDDVDDDVVTASQPSVERGAVPNPVAPLYGGAVAPVPHTTINTSEATVQLVPVDVEVVEYDDSVHTSDLDVSAMSVGSAASEVSKPVLKRGRPTKAQQQQMKEWREQQAKHGNAEL